MAGSGAVPSATDELIPLARPVLGPEEEQAVLEVLRSGQLSLGPRVAQFERAFAARVGAPLASAVSSGTAGLHLALRAVGVGEGDEVVTSPFSFVASANAALYERARPVFADIDPRHAQPRPGRRGGRDHASARARCCRCTSSATPPTCPRSRARRASRPGIVEDACEALGASHADGVAVGGRGHPAVFGFYANKQLTTGEGGMVTLADSALKQRIDSERNQGRAPNMGWLDHDRLGFNYRLSDIACALGIAQLDAWRRCSPVAFAWPSYTAKRSPGSHRGELGAAVRGPPTAIDVAGSCSSCSCRAASIATRPFVRSQPLASRASPTCRRFT